MSRRLDIPSPLTVRRWTKEDVSRALQQNGLGDVVQSFRKRNIDGNAFLRLTEIQLTTAWNHELSLTNIRKITKLIDDIKMEPNRRHLPLNRPAKPFDLRIPIKPEELPMLKPVYPPASLKNQGRNTDVGPVPGSRRGPAPVPPASGNWRDQVLLPTAQEKQRQPLSVPSIFGNKPSPIHIPPAIGNKRDFSSVPIPPTIGNRHGTVATSSAAGVAMGPRVPPLTIQNAGRQPPPVPLNKPQLHQPPCSKNLVRCPSPEKDETPEEPSALLKGLTKAFRMRAETLASQPNGKSTAKPEEQIVRPTLKPPVALRPPALKPMAHLPEPPSVATGQEEEHMKEIVSSIQIPSVSPQVNEIINSNEEMYENNSFLDEEIYEEPDMTAWEAAQAESPLPSHGGEGADGWKSDIYECIVDERATSGEYYIEPTVAITTSDQTEFESTHVQVEELPVAPSAPAKPKGGQSSFMSNFRSHMFRSTESKAAEIQSSRENNLLATTDKNEEDPKRFISRSISPNREKLTVSSELRKSPTSSTTSLISPIKGNAGQASSLPDQRLPPNLRPLPPTPGTSSFRSGPPNNTATVSRKICNSKTSINQQPWYHNVDRKRGEEIVFNREDGTFLIRPSTQNQNPYTLTIWFGKRVYNIAIRFRPDQKFALGSEKPNEQSFWSLEDMVAHYQTEQLVLYSGGERTGQTSLKSFP